MPGIILTENWNHTGAPQFVGARAPWSANRTDFLASGYGAFVSDNAPNADFVYGVYPFDGNPYCYTVDATSVDHYFSFVPKLEGAAYHGLIRYQDADNFIGIALLSGGVYYHIRANGAEPAAFTLWTSTPFDSNATYQIRAEGTTLKCYKAGVQIGATLTIPTPSPQATRVGFGLFSAWMNPFLGPVEIGFLGVVQSGTLIVQNSPVLTQMTAAGTTKSITVNTSWTGTPTALRRRLENMDGSVVGGFDWAPAITTPTGTQGNFTIANIPAGGPYYIRVDFANDASVTARQANGFNIGLIILALGQSNTVGLGQTGTVVPSEAGTYLWNNSTSSFGIPTGDGHIALLNRLRTALPFPIGLINVAISATNIASWQPGQPNYQAALAHLTAAGDCGAVLWGQGESDAGDAQITENNYRAGLTGLYSGLRTATSRTAGQLPFVIAITGRNARNLGAGAGTDASWSIVRAAQINWATQTTGGVIGAYCLDLPMADTLHYTNAGYTELGKRLGRSIAKTISINSVPYDGAGPKINSATRQNAIITVTIDLRGGTAISGTPPLTGWELSRDNFATLLTVQSTAVQNPDKIIFTLASTPLATDTVQLRYLYGANPDVTALVTGAAA
jgi:hypothetical protein